MGAIDFKALGAIAAAAGADQTKTVTGGGDYQPPAAGPCNLRFVSYIEVGRQKRTFKGAPKVQPEAWLTFELSGPKHQPTVKDDGTKMPHRLTIKLNLSLNEKAGFKKLFNRMNYKGDAQHMVQLLGEAYKGVVIHDEWEGKDKKKRIDAVLKDAEGMFTIAPPRAPIFDEDGNDTGEFRVVKVDPAITPLKAFLWEHADMEQWNALFIEGEYPERKNDKGEVTAKAKSKNVLQEEIKRAVNFVGSPIYNLLAANGASLDIPDAEHADDERETAEDQPTSPPAVQKQTVPTGAQADDALNGIA